MSTYSLRWGIAATGWMSQRFTFDLLADPATRGEAGIKHVVHAVASRSQEKAKEFVTNVWKEAGVTEGADKVKPYGSYEELYADPDVDCVYIGTPHSHHYRNVHDALTAGKNVLCEKAFTVNTEQAQILVDLARSKKLFLMEAVWTRFQPVSIKMLEVLRSGVIGDITKVESELGAQFSAVVAKNPDHRLANPALCGGALYDLGPYPWTQLALALLPPSKADTAPLTVPKISSSMIKLSTGVDASTVATLQFPRPDGSLIHGTMTATQTSQTPSTRCTLVEGTKGYLEIRGHTSVPDAVHYSAWESQEEYGAHPRKPATKSETFDFSKKPSFIWGWAYEADEVAKCIRDGKTESDVMPLRETILMMQVFDEIRKQNGLVYPKDIESLDL